MLGSAPEARLMRSSFSSSIGALAAIIVIGACRDAPKIAYREITLAQLRDKIAGGWAGQMIGVSYGGPTEFRHREAIIPEAELPEWDPDAVADSIRQDDLYLDMTFA